MHVSKHCKIILCLSFLTIFWQTDGNTTWCEDTEAFVATNLKLLRETRSNLNRPDFSFKKAPEILTFVEEKRQEYGTAAVASGPQLAELLVDVCDIVNQQPPDFKTRYDIFVEQWEGQIQLPFSLFSFDRIAQVFFYRSQLFNLGSGKAYQQMLERILEQDLPVLARAFLLICKLSDGRSFGGPSTISTIAAPQDYIQEINASLDQLVSLSGTAKNEEQKKIRAKVPSTRMKGLSALSAMAHDYLTLERIEKAVAMALKIPAFSEPEQREALLASMVQIGELTTNKNLSQFVKQYMPSIPWDDLIHCRDAIEHQDEHGFKLVFENLIKGSDKAINFKAWQAELSILSQRVSEARRAIWKNEHQTVFEKWLQGELSGVPTYGVVVRKPFSKPLSQVDKSTVKQFRQTPLFKENAELWRGLINGTAPVIHEALQKLALERQEAAQPENFLTAYAEVQAYLHSRIRDEAVHLNESEINTLQNAIQHHFHTPEIVTVCHALLIKEQSHLTTENKNQFFRAAVAAGLDYKDCKPILLIIERFKEELLVTRQVRRKLPFDITKDLDQPARKGFAKCMFVRTTQHLHELAHGPSFKGRMMQEIMTIPARFAFEQASAQNPKLVEVIEEIHATHAIADEYGYVNLTPAGQKLAIKALKESGLHFTFPNLTPEYVEFGKEVMNFFYRQAHNVHLQSAILRDPTRYLASVYSLSVGIGALKGWVLREPPELPTPEGKALEILRDGRNFIAHGDLLRNMNSIDLADIQKTLLTDHLDLCAQLSYTE